MAKIVEADPLVGVPLISHVELLITKPAGRLPPKAVHETMWPAVTVIGRQGVIGVKAVTVIDDGELLVKTTA